MELKVLKRLAAQRTGVLVLLRFVLCCQLALLPGASRADQALEYTLYTEELPPYSFSHEGKAAGLSVDIVSELFLRAGLRFDIRIVPWQRAYVATKNTPQACVFPLQRTQQREASFHWISPIVITRTGLYTLESSVYRIRTLADIAELTVGTYRGSAASDYLRGFGFDVDITANEAVNLHRLRYQRIPVWAVDTLTAHFLAKQAGVDDLKEQLVFFTSLRSLACNLAMPDALIKRLNNLLNTMHKEGTIARLKERYR